MFKQIIHYFKKEIYSGNLKPGDKLQSRRFYEIKFETSKKTVEKAIDFLEFSGFINSIPQKGYFVQNSEKQNWFKSENNLNNFDVKIYKENIQSHFNIKEIKNIFQFEKNIQLKDFYSYKKIYSINGKIKKVQLSWINNYLEYKKDEFKKSFYYYLYKNNIDDSSRYEVIRGGILIPFEIRKMLNINEKKGVVVFVLIKDDKNIPIQIVKTFRKNNDIDIKHINYIF